MYVCPHCAHGPLLNPAVNPSSQRHCSGCGRYIDPADMRKQPQSNQERNTR